MKEQFDLLRATRKNILAVLDSCTESELTTIPDGFNNNIIWNAAHVLATEQILVYVSTNSELRLDANFVDLFKKGTFPDSVDSDLISMVKSNLLKQVDQLEKDLNDQYFGEYETRMTSYGVELTNVEQAIQFVNLHEAMHLGQIKMLLRLIKS